jgi:hypothetical protein
MEGNVAGRFMSSRNATASLQSTVALTFRQGIAFIGIAFIRVDLGRKSLLRQSDARDRAFGLRSFYFRIFIWLQRLPP